MFIYNLVVLLYGFVIRLAAIRKKKAGQWVKGRKNWRENYRSKISVFNSSKIIWVHCASYGEFEQGRPVIEAIKRNDPQCKIVLTFFSPSGYEVFRHWGGAEVIGYLPLDTPSAARDFIQIVRPSAAIFIKYEFWLNYLSELKKQNIKTYLVSAVFKPHHPFFKWHGGIFRKSLATFTKLFIQDQSSGDLLQTIGITNYEVTGDTRFDRVVEVKENFKPVAGIEEFKGKHKIIIGGSTWPADEQLLINSFKKINSPEVKLILVPHEVDDGSIRKTVSLLKESGLSFALFSEKQSLAEKQVLVINTIGHLSKLYFYCDVAYIGGGFNDGIHNCLEAAVYLKPVIFAGNSHHKFNEAMELLQLNVATNIQNEASAVKTFQAYLNNPQKALEEKLDKYFKEKTGTTKKVIRELQLG
ncbi:MAG: 3-deoxy-D-manno-octulosonic acid transferase [Bacteroidetes bacterium]|jgi:3-deoxy-D-manno-octulosonic-acid transferase|nr:3-deoxy-D-manno-octulosonic acid transferase [Bacteroidota bacterium]